MFEELPRLEPSALLAVVEATHRDESVLMARRMAAVAVLLRKRESALGPKISEGYGMISGFDQTAAEVAAVMNLSAMAAGFVVSDAAALATRLPRVGALLAEGRTDWRTVRLIITRTDLVQDDELIARLDRSLAERIGKWHGWSRQRIVNAVDAAVRVIDPDAARERRVEAEDKRHVGINPLDNGMAEVYGTVAASAATAFDRRLSALAKEVCAADPRTMDQRRADALTALAQGRQLACMCGRSDCPTNIRQASADPGSGAVKVVINVVASEHTVLGTSGAPGYLAGYGVIDAEQVRALAAAAASLHAVDSETTRAQSLSYQPPAALERAVRCRDLTCRFPGCSRPAELCDVDHTVPFNHADPIAGGRTVWENLKCLCRLHHRLKTFGGWRDRQLADGTVVWTSPTGRIYRTSPAGADLFPNSRGPACAVPTFKKSRQAARRSARIAKARKQNRELRPVNEAWRNLEEGRKREIRDRKFRNHMRDMLFATKGGPSTSSFATWINDPRESEELPEGWTPPPSPPLPDDPPF